MNIALFGSAFDPPHIAHWQIPQYLLKEGLADESWFVPAKDHPFAKKMSSVEDRLAMLHLLIDVDHSKKTRIELFEIQSDQPSYSLLTLRGLSQRYPQHRFSWIIGADNVSTFTKWHDYQTILKNFSVFVYPRVGFQAEPLLPGMHFLSNAPVIATSSTDIRQKVQKGEPITGLVDPAIETYIEEHRLYL